ncbi:MAG: insulinase family protein [Desulfobacterales bacterium]|jgi:predicted Zn-dependent peptidase|nr:insulinase family protein [Desulfobacterales bacterium]
MTAALCKTVLANGVRIVSLPMAHTRAVSLGVWVNAGARDEADPENGLSHFIEHMIFKGTQKRSAFQIAKEFDAIGGHTNAFTTMEHTCYHAKVLDTQIDTMVEILSDIFLNSIFDPREVERERPVILQEIGMVEDSPDELIHTLACRSFWGDNPLGRSILGTRETVGQFSAETIRGFFRRLYQPARIVVAAAGNVAHQRLVDLVGPAFESVRSRSGFPPRIAPACRPQVTIHRRELEQVHICLGTAGLSMVDPQRYALSLLSTILGGNMSSRLFQEVREKRGLAYAVYSFSAAYTDTGMFGACLAVGPEQAVPAVELVAAELARIANAPVDPAELSGALEYTKGNLLLSSENADNQMMRVAQNELFFEADIPLEEVIACLESVTREEIQQLAQSLLGAGRTMLTLLGPVDAPQAVFENCLVPS